MSFYNHINRIKGLNYKEIFNQVTDSDLVNIINKEILDEQDFLKLLSPKATKFLEPMARKAYELNLNHFGKAITLFTPMYIANYCVNECAYCGYNVKNTIERKQLTLEEIEEEARSISSTGLRHILVLTGESPKQTPISYIIDAVKLLKKYFDSISIEIYPLTTEEYKDVVDAGVDGVTVYQEVYDEKIYDSVHIAGPKKDYHFRLDAPERACEVGMRSVNIGALLGLNEWRKEAFLTGLHAKYLQKHYNDVEFSISLPRLCPHKGDFQAHSIIEDQDLVQIMLALKIFLPYVGITISTREKADFRERLLPLGVNKLSAGVSTEVGGHSVENKGEMQFEISDERSVDEIKEMLLAKGYQPLLKNWGRF
jgi:2-iminoacetate synthase